VFIKTPAEDLRSIDIDGKRCRVFIVLALNAIVLNGKDLHIRVSVGKQSSTIVYSPAASRSKREKIE